MAAIHQLKPCHYEDWNDFCQEHHWFFHRVEWLEYLEHSKFGVEFKNHSFFIEQNGKITAIVPLLQEGQELISPGFDDRKEILQEVRRIAEANGIKRIRVNSQIREYLSISGYTCILDLENICPSKGHKWAIKKSEQFLVCQPSEDLGRFKKDYCRIAGKETRPPQTFWLLLAWIKQGFGTLLEAKFEDQTAGYVYLLHWLDRAYYFMGCSEPKFKQYNVGHFLIAQSFEILRQKDVRWLEMGQQVYNSPHHQPSEKERGISLFKKGFGGEIVASPVSEYFFDAQHMWQVHFERIKKYCEVEYENTTVLSEIGAP